MRHAQALLDCPADAARVVPLPAPGRSTVSSRYVARGPEALPTDLRGRFETSLGTDLSDVRVHTGEDSADRASALGAQAFTLAQDIHFGADRYDPDSADGRFLIAHEVAHAVQQRTAATGPQCKPLSGETRGADEHAADAAASAMVAGAPAPRPGEDPRLLLDMIRDANRAITRLTHRSRAWIDASETYLTHNMGRFAGYTEGAPKLGFTEQDAVAMVQSYVTGKVTKVASVAAVDAAGAIVGGAVGGPAGAAIGLVVGLVVKKAASYIAFAVTGKTQETEATAQAHVAGAEAATRAALGVKMSFREETRQLDDSELRLEDGLDAATTFADVFAIREDALAALAEVPPLPADDDALFQHLLSEWVLENAEDADEAVDGVDQAQWETARDEVAPDVQQRARNAFAYQTRKHWARCGIPDDQMGIVDWMTSVDDMTADRTPGWTFTRVNRFRFADMLEEETGDTRFADVIRGLGGDAMSETGLIEIHCRLHLDSDGGGLYVDEWAWHVSLGETPVAWSAGGLQVFGDRTLSFSVSP